MNKSVIFMALTAVALGCTTKLTEPESLVASCGVKNPIQELPWLKEIVTKAEEDKATMAHKGNYLGTIFLDKFGDEPIFMVRMMMGSGGLYAYAFGCDGKRIDFGRNVSATLWSDIEKNNNVLYTNMP